MNAVKVDSARRIRLPNLRPGDYYEAEVGPRAKQITLRLPPPPRKKMTKEEVVKAIKESRLKFEKTWDELRKETRE